MDSCSGNAALISVESYSPVDELHSISVPISSLKPQALIRQVVDPRSFVVSGHGRAARASYQQEANLKHFHCIYAFKSRNSRSNTILYLS
jgi:hypothetical protein